MASMRVKPSDRITSPCGISVDGSYDVRYRASVFMLHTVDSLLKQVSYIFETISTRYVDPVVYVHHLEPLASRTQSCGYRMRSSFRN